MNRFHRVCVVLLACLLSASVAFAQAKKTDEKSPADLKADAFLKLRDKPDAPPTPARLSEVMGAGLAFLNEYPADRRTSGVVASLATFGSTIKDKKLAAQKAAWLPQLKFELLRQTEGKGDDVRVALAALGAAIAMQELKDAPARSTIEAAREKIDALVVLPGSSRFLAEQEKAFIQFFRGTNLNLAEKAATMLLKHPDKAVVQVAKDELNLIGLMKTPVEFKGTALDGRDVDLAKLRGKVVLVVFWATTNEASVKELAVLKETYASYKRNGFEIVTVSQDRETDREAVAKFVKSAKIAWPVLFDGKGSKGELSQRVNARSLPASALFNASGTLIATGVRGGRVESELKKQFGIK